VRQNVVEKLLRVCVNIVCVCCYLFTTVKVVSFYHLVNLCHTDCSDQSIVWVKKSSLRFSDIFPNGWDFLNSFYTYYTFLSTLDDKFLFIYFQLWRSYAIRSATTQQIFFISLELLLSLLTEQMTSLLTSCHIRHVCWLIKVFIL